MVRFSAEKGFVLKFSPKGFTLLELMVAIALMMLIMGIVASIFSQGSATYRNSNERLLIYEVASFSLDRLVTDLDGCLPVEEGKQMFTLSEDAPGEDGDKARDKISFRATVPVNGEPISGEVLYHLVPDSDPSVLSQSGEPLMQTTRTKRPLYVLRREVKDLDGNPLSSMDLCHYVTSFNIEYYDRATGRFRQIGDLAAPRDNFAWPIGDNKPEGELLHSGLRVTLTIVAGAGENQERLLSQTIWLPLGQ